jgi:hypothetical protein
MYAKMSRVGLIRDEVALNYLAKITNYEVVIM